MTEEILALYYQKDARQIIVVYPLVWMHEINGDWFIKGNLS